MRKLKNHELERLTVEQFKNKDKNPIIIVLDNVRSLNNVGSVFRIADSFLIKKIYLCGITACPPHKDIHKTALGSTETVNWEYYQDTMGVLEKYKALPQHTLLSIEQAQGSCMLQNYQPKPGEVQVIIFGNEVKGVQQTAVNLSDSVLEIPQYGTKHSLNIATSTSLVVWDLLVKMSRIS